MALVPISFLLSFFIGRREANEGNTPLRPKKRPGRATHAGYFSFEFDEELKSLSTNCSVVKGRHFINLLSNDYKFC